jgi:lipid-A-disaccharide synthase
MGYSEVITKIPFYINAKKKLVEEVKKRNCKKAILIDFQGFNMKMAKELKEMGVDVLYYVAPQAWSWKEYRAYKIAKYVHTLFTIIDFEKEWFKQRGVKKIVSVTHPSYTRFKSEFENLQNRSYEETNKEFTLLLLPGSRNSEVSRLFPEFVDGINRLKQDGFNFKVELVQTGSVNPAYYELYGDVIDHFYESDELTNALHKADFCFAASGTVTLACALFEVPTVVSYKVSLLNAFIAYNFVDIYKYISLGNIVLDQKAFPELLQDEASGFHFHRCLTNWLNSKESYERIKQTLKQTKHNIAGDNINVADYMSQVINEDS